MIFARFPLVRYKLALAEGWSAQRRADATDTQVSDFIATDGDAADP